MNYQEFLKYSQELGIDITKESLEQLKYYAEILIEYNKHTNLTAIKTKEEIYLKHFFDSLTLVKIVDLTKNIKLLDIGTGAGFPGLVIAILFPQIQVDLLDSNHKKIDFLNFIIEKLNLSNVKTIYARAEEYVKKVPEKYDYITSRAVKELRIILEISFCALKVGGYFLAMKSNISEELLTASDTISILNGKIENKIEFELPLKAGKRTLLKIKKISKTPNTYPRAYNSILKKPLKKKNN